MDLDAGRIVWRGETDKMGLTTARPTTRRVMRYLRVWQKHCPSVVWVFPALRDTSKPVDKAAVQAWARMPYDAAGYTRPRSLGWHSLRRKWATERRGYSLSDLMIAGGWLSADALMRYLKTHAATISTVIHNPTTRV